MFKATDTTTPVAMTSVGVHVIKIKGAHSATHGRAVRLLQEGLRALAYVTPVTAATTTPPAARCSRSAR